MDLVTVGSIFHLVAKSDELCETWHSVINPHWMLIKRGGIKMTKHPSLRSDMPQSPKDNLKIDVHLQKKMQHKYVLKVQFDL